VSNPSDANRRSQQAVLNDLAHAQWEARADFGSFLNEMLKQQEEQDRDRKSDEERYATDLTHAEGISDAPLPHLFHADGFSGPEVFASSCEWKSAYLKDVPGQSKRGDFYDHLKM
jgi:hypothetical protein